MSVKAVIGNFIKALVVGLLTVGLTQEDIGVESFNLLMTPDSFLIMTYMIVLNWKQLVKFDNSKQKNIEYALDSVQILGFYLITLYVFRSWFPVNINLISIIIVFGVLAIYLGLVIALNRNWVIVVATLVIFFLLYKFSSEIGFIHYNSFGHSFMLALLVMIVVLTIIILFKNIPREKAKTEDEAGQRRIK